MAGQAAAMQRPALLFSEPRPGDLPAAAPADACSATRPSGTRGDNYRSSRAGPRMAAPARPGANGASVSTFSTSSHFTAHSGGYSGADAIARTSPLSPLRPAAARETASFMRSGEHLSVSPLSPLRPVRPPARARRPEVEPTVSSTPLSPLRPAPHRCSTARARTHDPRAAHRRNASSPPPRARVRFLMPAVWGAQRNRDDETGKRRAAVAQLQPPSNNRCATAYCG